LRQQRLRRGLSLEEAAAGLRVPAKSLRALEWDRRDLLGSPDEASKLQLRYASFLGLATEALTYPTGEEAPAPAAPRPRLRPTRAVWLPLLAALAPAVVIVVLIFLGQTGAGESAAETLPEPRASSISAPEESVTVTSARAPASRKDGVSLVLTADGGASWVEAHSGSATGPLLFQGTLENGRELRLAADRIWLRLGAANNVALAVNGRASPRALFGTVDVLVTPRGIEPA
jgi:cytoskeleton protein RodZ